jgi:hypothetical protein
MIHTVFPHNRSTPIDIPPAERHRPLPVNYDDNTVNPLYPNSWQKNGYPYDKNREWGRGIGNNQKQQFPMHDSIDDTSVPSMVGEHSQHIRGPFQRKCPSMPTHQQQTIIGVPHRSGIEHADCYDTYGETRVDGGITPDFIIKTMLVLGVVVAFTSTAQLSRE